MAGVWVTESLFSWFTVVLPFKTLHVYSCALLICLFLEMWRKLDLRIIWKGHWSSSFFGFYTKYESLCLFLSLKRVFSLWKLRSYTPVLCKWSAFQFCSSTWRMLLGWSVIFQTTNSKRTEGWSTFYGNRWKRVSLLQFFAKLKQFQGTGVGDIWGSSKASLVQADCLLFGSEEDQRLEGIAEARGIFVFCSWLLYLLGLAAFYCWQQQDADVHSGY